MLRLAQHGQAADADPVVSQDDDRACLQILLDRREAGEDRGCLLGCPTANEPPDAACNPISRTWLTS
jgi:hypothetical protein